MKNSHVLLILALFAVLVRPATAGIIVPASYTATTGQGWAEGGTWNYFDDTGVQLTDGIYGVDNWTANLGYGNAQEWVGWITVNPTLTFAFNSPVTVNKVSIDFARAEPGAGIYLPTQVTIGGVAFALSGAELADQTRGTLEFVGSWTGNSLSVEITTRGRNWVFVDEVQFSAVPEPAHWAGASGLGLVVFCLHRRWRMQRNRPQQGSR